MQEGIVTPEIEDNTGLTRTQRIKIAATEKIREGKEIAAEVHTTAEDYIRAHPTKCVMGAFGIGLVIGLIIRR